ncbi:MAG: site-specific DNA-methyltransferase [Bacillota bacterium]
MPATDGNLTIEYVPIGQLKPFDGNPRKISDKGLEKLQRSVEEFGFVNPVLAQRGTNTIIAGHQRLKAAKAAGLTEVPVVWLDMDDMTAKAYNIADNRLQDEAEWDFAPLADLLTELDTGAFDLTLTGFDDVELAKMMNYSPDGVKEDEVPEPPEEPVTKLGDIWQLGRHRVMCGNSTSPENFRRLMQDATADMVFTDPPYNVNYVGKTADSLTIENDCMTPEQFQEFIRAAFACIDSALRPGGVVYVCHADSGGHIFRAEFLAAGWHLAQCIVWAKDSFVLGRQDYHWRHEPILYGWKQGAAHYWIGDRDQDTVWEIPRPKRSAEHPTMKPVELVSRALHNSGRRGEVVLDPFLGSGTTLVAAEQLDRVCYGMEIDPRYCDVTVKRWEQLTGKHAELVQNQ